METCTIEATCNVLEPSSMTNVGDSYKNSSSNVVNSSSSLDSPTEACPEQKTVVRVTSEGTVCNEGSPHVGEDHMSPVEKEESSTVKIELHHVESNLISVKEDIETSITTSPVVGNYITLSDGKTGDSEQSTDSVEIIKNNLLNVANETHLSVETITENVDIKKDPNTHECKDIILVPVSIAFTECQSAESKDVSVKEIPEWDNSRNLLHSKSSNDSATENVDTVIEIRQPENISTVDENDMKVDTNCEDAITAETLIAISILQNNLGNINANKSSEQLSGACNNNLTDDSNLNELVTKENKTVLRKPLTPISVEIGVQANDYEIERRSGKVPARRRVIPYKFRDYRNVDLVEQTNDSDSDYYPSEGEPKAPKKRKVTPTPTSTGRRPGRPRKICLEKTENEPSPSLLLPPPPPPTTTAELTETAAAVAATVTEPINELVELTDESATESTQHIESVTMTATEDKLPSSVDIACTKKMDGIVSSNKSNFFCKICHREFTQKGNLKVHMRVHTGEKPFECNFNCCAKRFRNNESLRRHNLVHLGIKPFACDICNNKFSSKISLLEHVAIHTNSKPHVCHICQLPFRQISCLRRHLITHSSDKPYECNRCGQKFSQMVYLKSHSKVHTGEKPFVCDHCNRGFAHQSDVTRHKIIHTGKKPFVCNLCHARFSDPSSKRRHVKEHLGSKPYTCDLCGDSFKRAGQLKVHTTRKHSEHEGNFKIEKSTSQLSYKENDKIQGGSVSRVAIDNKPTAYHKKLAQIVEGLTGSEVTHIATPVSSGNVILEETNGSSSQTVAQVVATAMQSAGIGTISANEREQFSAICQAASHEHSANYENTANQIAATIVEQDLPSLIENTTDGATVITIVSLEDVEQNPNEACAEQVEVPVEYAQQLIENVKSDNQSHFVELHYEESNDSVKQEEIATNSQHLLHSEKLEGPVDFVSKPDFSSQEYYDWLSNFTEVCKVLPMPLSPDLFQKISQVHKTLSDVMATPSGVLADKDNFRILMYISSDLHTIICEHLSFVLQNLDNEENNQMQ